MKRKRVVFSKRAEEELQKALDKGEGKLEFSPIPTTRQMLLKSLQTCKVKVLPNCKELIGGIKGVEQQNQKNQVLEDDNVDSVLYSLQPQFPGVQKTNGPISMIVNKKQ